jgi:uncharacterized SAM-binding protein YcdF (DUF218 family)
MFFILSKMFWALARPLNFLFILALAGMIAGRFGLRKARAAALTISIALFVLSGFTQLADYLIFRLETAVPSRAIPPAPAAIIVLGGGIASQSAAGGTGYQLAEASDRLVKALELRRLHPQARFIYSGGSGALIADQLPETVGARAMVEALYGDDRGMELESRSRTTFENAVEVRKMLGEDASGPLLLVTSAFHMPRAIGCFRQLGMDVIPVPTDFRADEMTFPFLTDEAPNQFLKMSLLVKEIIGLAGYYASGRTSALLPR